MSVEDSSRSFQTMRLEDKFRLWTPFNNRNTALSTKDYNTSLVYENSTSGMSQFDSNTSAAQPDYPNRLPVPVKYLSHPKYGSSSAAPPIYTIAPSFQKNAPEVQQNFCPPVFNNNYNASGFSQNRQSFKNAGLQRISDANDQVMPRFMIPRFNMEQEILVPNHVYEKHNFVPFNGQGSRFQAPIPQVINVQNGYNPGYAARNYFTPFTPESPSNSSFMASPAPIKRRIRAGKMSKPCGFCRQNGDPPQFYTKHELKDSKGNVTCPILSRYTCEVCSATGEKAHTISYCPVLRSTTSVPIKNAKCLKNTLRNSSGRLRK